MKSYPEIYILGKIVEGKYVQYSTNLGYFYQDIVQARNAAFILNLDETEGAWKILEYGRPRTVGE